MSGVVKKIPERMCVACRQMKPKTELIRIVSTENGVIIDKTGKVNGRGVYVCACKECVAKTAKNKGFHKQHGFSLTEEIVSEMESMIEKQN